jgi:alpha-tubulin suppressor-like RCC1 family protein
MSAVRTNATLWLWGDNTSGQLGDGTTVNKSSPVSVIALQGNWSKVSAGVSQTAAISKGIL